MALSLSGPERTARCCSPEPRSERQALTVLSSPCSQSVRNPPTPGTAMPSPHPAACLTSCCTRTCAPPQGQPCLGAGPLPPPIPWAPARWAVMRPEVGQVWWWCWQRPNPMARAYFSRWVSGLFGQWSPKVPGHPSFSRTPGHRPMCTQAPGFGADQVPTGIELAFQVARQSPQQW